MPPEPQARRAALSFIFITVLLDMLALGIIIPVLPKLVFDFVGGDTARAAEAIGLFTTAWALMQFIFSPLLGLLSDRFGRRPVILLSNLGLGLDYIVMALAPTLGWLFVGRVLSGITSASIPTATAYISDVTPPEKRAGAFGLLGAAFGVGFVLGPALGGALGVRDPRLPFSVAGACSLLNALYGWLVLPESLPVERRQKELRWRSANPVGALSFLRSHPTLLGLGSVNFLGYVAHEVYATVFVLYATYRYGWNAQTIGLSLAVVGVSSMVISAGVVRPVVKRFGERQALLAGLLMGALGFALFGWATLGWIFMAAIPINGLWALAGKKSCQDRLTAAIACSCRSLSKPGARVCAIRKARLPSPLNHTPWRNAGIAPVSNWRTMARNSPVGSRAMMVLDSAPNGDAICVNCSSSAARKPFTENFSGLTLGLSA